MHKSLSCQSLFVVAAGLAACNSGIQSRFDANISANDPYGRDGGGGMLGGGDGGAPCVSSPDNFDIPGNNCDDDGDGKVDNTTSCDSSLAIDGNAASFAKALGLCRSATSGGWGVVSAEYRGGYASSNTIDDGQHGILPKFGASIKPREGSKIGVISSGYAREFDDEFGTSGCFIQGGDMLGNYSSDILPGYPKSTAGCSASTEVNDVIVVRLKLRVPANAKGIGFDFNFFTSEWPSFVCSTFNDGFLAVLQSKAFNNGKPENISFDPNNNPVSVNNDFFDRCTPNVQTGCYGDSLGISKCAGGEAELLGTGYYCKDEYCFGGGQSTGGGATGWLETKAPVLPGETITLDFMIWDTGDNALDSSALIDNFRWEAGETTIKTDRPR